MVHAAFPEVGYRSSSVSRSPPITAAKRVVISLNSSISFQVQAISLILSCTNSSGPGKRALLMAIQFSTIFFGELFKVQFFLPADPGPKGVACSASELEAPHPCKDTDATRSEDKQPSCDDLARERCQWLSCFAQFPAHMAEILSKVVNSEAFRGISESSSCSYIPQSYHKPHSLTVRVKFTSRAPWGTDVTPTSWFYSPNFYILRRLGATNHSKYSDTFLLLPLTRLGPFLYDEVKNQVL